ncbi:MAG: efflux transporter periplasmic adaptor subunit [Oceanospirillaceae bacterium]|nr:efflux transporter periplasmic adaptor subunit [Oceanospirillaceae bacterium]MBT13037.1 efflux transporter periplasmic adaptor subunit [Oceanospirillaceae bacterium]|tara:strand:- start:45979 stop:46839 length:861 start_codon:yes stop_codon:yes gene_type:complete
MQKTLRIVINLAILAAAIAAGYWVWHVYMHSPWTRDGRIRADVITIAPDVSGWVSELQTGNNQRVSAGDVLFTVNDERYKAAVAESKARVEQARYAWELARHQYQRRKKLNKNQNISADDLDVYRIQMDSARASYDLAQAQLNTAMIDVERSQVVAPVDGNIINPGLSNGNYVSKGTPVLSLVKAGSFYVTGYFEETKLQKIHVGQTASVQLMSGGQPLTGRVVSIGKGIANNNTSGDAQLLPQVQQSFNWVRLAQRIPVDIELDPVPEDIHLSAGMTATIEVETD